MILTAREEFVGWYEYWSDKNGFPVDYTDFEDMALAIRYGVYLLHFDELGIRINSGKTFYKIYCELGSKYPGMYFSEKPKSRLESWKMSIDHAFELAQIKLDNEGKN